MKFVSFAFIIALICVCFVQIEGSSRVRREEDTLEQIQTKLSEGFDSVKKATEEWVSKVDFKQIQQDISSKFNEFAKSISDFTSGAGSEGAAATEDKKPEASP